MCSSGCPNRCSLGARGSASAGTDWRKSFIEYLVNNLVHALEIYKQFHSVSTEGLEQLFPTCYHLRKLA